MENPLVLREVLRYIPMYRGTVFVVKVSGRLIADTQAFANIIVDAALLAALGIRPVLVYGANSQIESAVAATGGKIKLHQGYMVIEPAHASAVRQACALTTLEVTESLTRVSQSRAPLRVLSGNFITARRKGVIDGFDFQLIGELETLDVAGLTDLIQSGVMPIISSLATSKSGEMLYVFPDELAAEVAIRLGAKKLVYLMEGNGIFARQELIRQLTPHEAGELVNTGLVRGTTLIKLKQAIRACEQGVPRVHLINGHRDGSLLVEMFSRDGSGTMVYNDVYADIRQATLSDIQRIMEMAAEPVSQGRLIHRTVEQVQAVIEQFYVYEKDGQVIGCCQLVPWPEHRSAEIAHLVVDPQYRHHHIAILLVEYLEREAVKSGRIGMVFALTTRSESWFINRGYQLGNPDLLPPAKRQTYDKTRNSKVLVKHLEQVAFSG
ncbi:MAG: amino-acid N-acetyltransferase [Candidatus Buchananbacteria bacterium]|nr:amino-acid N-acetyltransferase [Candidatus Buchananbacteria bacterium]